MSSRWPIATDYVLLLFLCIQSLRRPPACLRITSGCLSPTTTTNPRRSTLTLQCNDSRRVCILQRPLCLPCVYVHVWVHMSVLVRTEWRWVLLGPVANHEGSSEKGRGGGGYPRQPTLGFAIGCERDDSAVNHPPLLVFPQTFVSVAMRERGLPAGPLSEARAHSCS
jgi:hypothetical protein